MGEAGRNMKKKLRRDSESLPKLFLFKWQPLDQGNSGITIISRRFNVQEL